MSDFDHVVDFIRTLFPKKDTIHLHEPNFSGNEKMYVVEAIESTFVSSNGPFVTRFEEMLSQFTGSPFAVAAVNGTAALHTALLASGVEAEDEVLTQALTFVATANAITYVGARPVFIDVDMETWGMSAGALESFLNEHAELRNNIAYNKVTKRRIAACLPMHTFGFPCDIERIASVCQRWNLVLIEDAAESLGSTVHSKHTGTFGTLGVFSFNGNKTITCGSGGAVVSSDRELAKKVRHLTVQAKTTHAWEFNHDMIGYNYRMSNLNAALGCAQFEQLPKFIENKRELASLYKSFFAKGNIRFKTEPMGCKANYWLNAIQLNSLQERDSFLRITNARGVLTRPAWTLMNRLPMFEACQHDGLRNSLFLADRVVNLPSSVRVL